MLGKGREERVDVDAADDHRPLKDGVKIGFNLKGMGLPSLPDDFLGGGRIQLGEPVRGFDWKMLRPRVVPFEKALRPPPVGQPTPPGAAEAVPPKGRRLGVMIQDLPDALRDYLELAPGVGLMIESVQSGTLAASLRLRAGDIVVGISGTATSGAACAAKRRGPRHGIPHDQHVLPERHPRKRQEGKPTPQ